MLDWAEMRTALLVIIIANWLLPQTGSSLRTPAGTFPRQPIATIEVSLSDTHRQLSELNDKVSLFLGFEVVVGVLLLAAAWKSLERRANVAPLPAPAYAPYPPYAAPGFRQWEVEALARRIVEELRRDAETRQPAKSTPA
jgi:hypothetical protein